MLAITDTVTPLSGSRKEQLRQIKISRISLSRLVGAEYIFHVKELTLCKSDSLPSYQGQNSHGVFNANEFLAFPKLHLLHVTGGGKLIPPPLNV
ncbi:Hypothetical predicted protein [Podarcis lilfordi]|uniref:Uncharacterized protein n=1 Tax=Podarcis lilfordi TaxID=74358 RepID=A0AA35L0P8_9SAUR|nr:Hypothetical predicted protein [Podarcis lilfordi]